MEVKTIERPSSGLIKVGSTIYNFNILLPQTKDTRHNIKFSSCIIMYITRIIMNIQCEKKIKTVVEPTNFIVTKFP